MLKDPVRMEEDEAWRALGPDEQKSVLNQGENNFWSTLRKELDAEHAEAKEAFDKATSDTRVELGALTEQRNRLAETQRRIALELGKVEEELAHVALSCSEKASFLDRLEHEYREAVHKRLEKERDVSRTMRKYFRSRRGEKGDSGSDSDMERPTDFLRKANATYHRFSGSHVRGSGGEPYDNRARLPPPPPLPPLRSEDTQHQANGTARPSLPPPRHLPTAYAPKAPNALVDIVDSDGAVLGAVERIEPWNQWVDAIQDVPIKRPVMIRRGRKFNRDHVASIYDRSEAKGVKWLSCMIQATGDIQQHRCVSCDKNQGAFEHCTILGGALFQKCGNCEWNRQGCHRQGPFETTPPPLLSKRHSELHELSNPARDQLLGREPIATTADHRPTGFSALKAAELRMRGQEVAQQALAKAYGLGQASRYNDIRPVLQSNSEIANRPPRQMKGIQILNSDPSNYSLQRTPNSKEPREYTIVSGFTPANTRSRPPSREFQTPMVMSTEPSPHLVSTELEGEITRDTLVLRDNGIVYTYPPCMEGVPLAKIDENHPYWDPKWPNVKALIEPILQTWKQKYDAAVEAKANGEQVSSARFQTGRQVNRGLKIIEFLDEGEISPYQLLSKRWIHTGKGAVTSYDTLFRLSDTLSELAKFKLDVTPVQWLRQRLYELMQVQGSSFNFPRTIHDFYHDPKLTALRYKNGYKNIGRPSGLKMGPRNPSTNSTPAKAEAKKRKSLHSQTETPRETPSAEQSPQLSYQESNTSKRAKQTSPTPGSIPEDSQTAEDYPVADVSDTDSYADLPSGRTKFHLDQIKTKLYTSETKLAQYWLWDDEKRTLAYTVLKDTDPVIWGKWKQPVNFDLCLDEVKNVTWSTESLNVHLALESEDSSDDKDETRDEVMLAFPGTSTLNRFLQFCHESKITVTEETLEIMKQRWTEMESKHVLGPEEEANKDLFEKFSESRV